MPLSILDLPTELLLAIITETDLPSQDVYSLALVCRRLHFAALPVYFSRHGLPSSTRSVQITIRTDRRDLLAALRVALFDTPLDHINFIFSPPDPDLDPITTSVTPLIEQLQRVQGFLSDSTCIKHVSLDLDHRDCVSYLTAGSDDAPRAWAKGLGAVLNCILETQCTTLTVLHGRYLAKAYELPPIVKPVSWLGRLISWVYPVTAQQPPESQRVSQHGVERIELALPREFSRVSQLTCIHIHSTTLILPLGLKWTLGVLRSCPISQITFSKIAVESDVWGSVLPLIASAAPSLTSVGFVDLEILPAPEIMAFVAQLHRLEDLAILPSDRDELPRLLEGVLLLRSRTPPPHLPHLTHLRTDPAILCHLLRGGSLPALKDVTVSFHPILGVGHIAQILTAISGVLAADAHAPAPLLVVATTPSSQPLRSYGGDVPPEFSDVLDGVQRLEIDYVISTAPAVVEEAIRCMALRVAAFRRATSVAIKLEPHADVGNLPQRLASSIVRTEFLQAIEVNGRVYPLVHGDGR
ncbi:hypothetical protein DFH06DRAFT_754293 [Mycena polygramma]|nr:hypothetical protein DFH06DRAFT_754293 [Mycena polygramma]